MAKDKLTDKEIQDVKDEEIGLKEDPDFGTHFRRTVAIKASTAEDASSP